MWYARHQHHNMVSAERDRDRGGRLVEGAFLVGGAFGLVMFSFANIVLGPHRPFSNSIVYDDYGSSALGGGERPPLAHYNRDLSILEYTSLLDGKWFPSINRRLFQRYITVAYKPDSNPGSLPAAW